MVFNYCIYGKVIGGFTGDITLTFYDNTITEILTKTYTILEDEDTYQFNLGDSDLLSINHILTHGSSVVISIDTVFFDNIILDLTKQIFRYDIDINKTPVYTDNEVSGEYETMRIVTDKLTLIEEDLNLYSYFVVTKDDEIIYESNLEFNWVPKVNGVYVLTQRGYNKSNNIVTEKQSTIDILENYIETESIDYVYYTKRNKVLQIELPNYVKDTLLLHPDFYFENGKLLGKVNSLIPLKMDYTRGKVIVKTQVGDIVDY